MATSITVSGATQALPVGGKLFSSLPLRGRAALLAAAAIAKDIAKPALIALLGMYVRLSIIRPAIRRLAPPLAAPGPAADGAAAAPVTGAYGANALACTLALENARQMARLHPEIVANVVKMGVSGNE